MNNCNIICMCQRLTLIRINFHVEYNFFKGKVIKICQFEAHTHIHTINLNSILTNYLEVRPTLFIVTVHGVNKNKAIFSQFYSYF